MIFLIVQRKSGYLKLFGKPTENSIKKAFRVKKNLFSRFWINIIIYPELALKEAIFYVIMIIELLIL